MKWYKNLFLGESIAPKTHQIIKKIKNNKLTPDVYVIAFASNPKNLLDIIPTWEMLQGGYPKEKLCIIGLAKGKQEAIALVTDIVAEVYEKTGDVKIREYLQNEWREQT